MGEEYAAGAGERAAAWGRTSSRTQAYLFWSLLDAKSRAGHAERYVVGSTAGRPRVGDESRIGLPDWLPEFPPVAGELCAQALVSRGWIPVEWTAAVCCLVRNGQRIVIPRTTLLNHETIANLLRTAEVQPMEFIEALESVCARDIEDICIRNTGVRPRIRID